MKRPVHDDPHDQAMADRPLPPAFSRTIFGHRPRVNGDPTGGAEQPGMEIGVGTRRKWAGFLLWAFFYLLIAGVLVVVFLRFTASTMWAVALVGFMLAYMTLMGWWTSRSLGERTKDDF